MPSGSRVLSGRSFGSGRRALRTPPSITKCATWIPFGPSPGAPGLPRDLCWRLPRRSDLCGCAGDQPARRQCPRTSPTEELSRRVACLRRRSTEGDRRLRAAGPQETRPPSQPLGGARDSERLGGRPVWVDLRRWCRVEGGRSSRRAANGFTGWKAAAHPALSDMASVEP